MSEPAFVVTCEHAGNQVPAAYRRLFEPHAALLATHRGWDPGALQLARTLARKLSAPLVVTRVTRLLVDANRSLHHPRILSEITRGLPEAERRRIVTCWWSPYRESVLDAIRSAGAPVVHLSAHSFTPVLDGRVRNVDVGFLYDPKRPWERVLVAAWSRALGALRPDLRVRRNTPYRGDADGHTTALRRQLPDAAYAGIEIEVNQALTTGDAATWRRLQRDIGETIATTSRCPV